MATELTNWLWNKMNTNNKILIRQGTACTTKCHLKFVLGAVWHFRRQFWHNQWMCCVSSSEARNLCKLWVMGFQPHPESRLAKLVRVVFNGETGLKNGNIFVRNSWAILFACIRYFLDIWHFPQNCWIGLPPGVFFGFWASIGPGTVGFIRTVRYTTFLFLLFAVYLPTFTTEIGFFLPKVCFKSNAHFIRERGAAGKGGAGKGRTDTKSGDTSWEVRDKTDSKETLCATRT